MMMPSIFGESLFDDFLDGFTRPLANSNRYATQINVMKTDVKEMKDSYELDIELPGVKKEDVKAELKDGYLTVNAAHGSQKDEKDENGKYIRRERYYGSSSRSFYIGEGIKQEDVKAKFEDGILKLVVPKVQKQPEVEKKQYISIEG
jgi:HSP20 family molecular chaperone IbpA